MMRMAEKERREIFRAARRRVGNMPKPPRASRNRRQRRAFEVLTESAAIVSGEGVDGYGNL